MVFFATRIIGLFKKKHYTHICANIARDLFLNLKNKTEVQEDAHLDDVVQMAVDNYV